MQGKCDTGEEMLAKCFEENRALQMGLARHKLESTVLSVFYQIEKMHSQIWCINPGRSL